MRDANSKIVQQLDALTRTIAKTEKEFRHSLERIENDINELTKSNNTPHKTPSQRLWQHFRGVTTPSGWWKAFAALSLVIGFLSSIYSLHSRVSVSAGESLDPANAFNTTLTVSNDGVLPIYDIEISCGINEILFGKRGTQPTPDWRKLQPTFKTEMQYTGPGSGAPIIRAGQRFTTNRFCSMNGITDYADIALIVSYRELGLPTRQRRYFRLVTERTWDGRNIWLQQPF